jgi:hypothetical protein
MKVDIDYKFGQPIYIKNDDEQIEYLLYRIILQSKGVIYLELSCPDGSVIEVAEMFCTKEKNPLRAIGVKTEEEE